MIGLSEYMSYIFEGGASGHMPFPYDFDDYTCQDLINIISSLLTSHITDITEKLDGTNIQATKNKAGQVVFVRNKSDLNSTTGGMTIEMMADKWKDKPSIRDNFLRAGNIIKKVFDNINVSWFNPDPNTKKLINCECITSGKTNIIPYASDQVDFHDIWIYKFNGVEWIQEQVTKKGLDVIESACKEIDSAKITPRVIIDSSKEATSVKMKYIKKLLELFGSKTKTVDEFLKERFNEYMSQHYKDIIETDVLYKRFFKDDKSANLRELKKNNPDQAGTIDSLCKKDYKDIVHWAYKPLDHLFISIGNDVIRLCKNLTNDTYSDAVDILTTDLQSSIKELEDDINPDKMKNLARQLERMTVGGNIINNTEGIVFRYKGRTMKLTGTFSPLNAIINEIKFKK